ncbi:hypothetical protein F5Y06DRAFT_266007 [Hypoxylon sp. FL0890]|nr:hypothetical protein F5Y06DRAFT_266007 [Hypoxylon sp. FL0890]
MPCAFAIFFSWPLLLFLPFRFSSSSQPTLIVLSDVTKYLRKLPASCEVTWSGSSATNAGSKHLQSPFSSLLQRAPPWSAHCHSSLDAYTRSVVKYDDV